MTSSPQVASSRRRSFQPRLNAVCSALALLALHPATLALPQGATPTFGQTSVTTNGTQMTIVQGSQRAGIDWQSFSIGSGEGLVVRQPDARSTLFNRVLGTDPSLILGKLQSNGRVFLSNPRGVVFGKGSMVDVGSLVATTLSLSDEAMLADRYDLSRGATLPGELTQEGSIHASGTVALVSPVLVQRGSIVAPRIGLAAADAVKVDVEGDGLIFFNVRSDTLDSRLQVLGTLNAEGGLADLRAQARAGFADTVLNMDGIVMAHSAQGRNGRIHVDGGTAGVTDVRGTLDASGTAPGQTGGSVTLLGDKVGLFDQARIEASGAAGGGSILVGGNYQGKGPERNAAATYVGPQAELHADALDSGHGGRAIVWADGSTQFYGQVTARGGAEAGDGGFAEVSGHDYLDFQGKSDLRAPNGGVGTLLLDPRNLTIGGTGNVGVPPDNTVPIVFRPIADDAVLTWTTINNALGNANVLVTTNGSTGTQNGDIVIATDSVGTGFLNGLEGGNLLTIDAFRNIMVNAGVQVQRAAAGGLTFTAGGSINVAGTGGIEMQGGKVTMTSAGTGGISLNGAITGAGDVTLSATGAGNGLNLASQISAGTGTVRLGSAGGSITQSAGGSISGASLSATAPTGSVALLGANAVTGNLAGSAGGAAADFNVNATGRLLIGQVSGDSVLPNTVSGVTAARNVLMSSAGGGGISVNAPVDAGADVNLSATGTGNGVSLVGLVNADATVRLRSANGSIVQTGGGITAVNLSAAAPAGGVSLAGSNAISGNLAGQAGGTGADFGARTTGDLTVGPVSGSGTLPAINGVTATRNIVLSTPNELTINQPLTAGTTGGVGLEGEDDIVINANVGAPAGAAVNRLVLRGAAVSRLSGTISATTIAVDGVDAASLAFAQSLVPSGPIAAANVERYEYRAATGDLVVPAAVQAVSAGPAPGPGSITVAGVDGISADEVRLQAVVGDVLQGTGTIRANELLGIKAGSNIVLNGNNRMGDGSNSSAVAALNAGGNIAFRDTGGGGYTIGAVAASADALVDAVQGIRITGGGTTTQLTTTGGTVQQASGVDGAVLSSNLLLRGAGAYSLTNTANATGTLAADSGAGALRYADADALVVGSVTPVTGGAAVDGIDRTGDVTLRTATSDLTLAQNTDVGTATLRLQAAGAIAQTGGTITAGSLGARAGTSATLDRPNAVSSSSGGIAGVAGDGNFKFVNALATRVTSVGADALFDATQGVTASRAVGTTNDITLNVTGAGNDLVLAANVDTGATGTVRLDASGGSIGQTAGAITTLDLAATAAQGSVVLPGTANAVSGNVAGIATGAGGDFGVQTGGALTIGAVIGGSTGTDLGGVTATRNIVLSTSAGNLAVNAPLSAGEGVGLEASGAIAINADVGAAGAALDRLVLRGSSVSMAGGAIVSAQRVAADGLDTSSMLLAQSISPLVAAQNVDSYQFRLNTGDLVVPVVDGVSAGPAAGAGPMEVGGVSGITADEIRLQAAGGRVLQEPGALIRATDILGIKASGDIVLNEANRVGSGADNSAIVAMFSGGSIAFTEAAGGGYTVGEVSSTGLVDLMQGMQASGIGATLALNTSGGEVQQAGEPSPAVTRIAADNLLLRGNAAYTLTNEVNAVATLVVETGSGAVSYVDSNDVTVGVATGVAGISRDADVSLRSMAGSLTLAEDVNVGPATVRLQAGGNITGGTVVAGTLGARAGGTVDLDIAVGGVAATGGNVRLSSGSGYTVVGVGNSDRNVIKADGSTTEPVFQAVSGLNATTTIELETGAGEVTQQATSNLAAANLLLHGQAAYTFNNQGNGVAAIAADTGAGAIHYVDANGLTVDAVAPVRGGDDVQGIARSGDVSLLALAGDLTLARDAAVGGATLRLQAAGGNVSGGTASAGVLGASAAGNVDLGIAVGVASAEGANVRLESGGSYTVGAVGSTGIQVRRPDGTLGSPVFTATDGLQAAATIELDTTAGEVSQQPGRDLAATALLLRGGASYTLANGGNAVQTIAADTGGGAIHYVDADSLAVDAVNPVRGGGGVLGIVRSGDVALRTLGGDLSLLENADVGGQALRLQASGGSVLGGTAIVGGATAVAGSLGARATGDVDLDIHVGTVSADAARVRLTSTASYSVDAVADSQADVAGGGAASGSAVFQRVDGLRAVTVIELDSSDGEVTQQAGRNVSAPALLLRGGGTYTLTNEGNAVATLAADGGGGAIAYVDKDGLVVGSVDPLHGPAAVDGIVRGSDVSLRTLQDDLVLAQGADVGSAILRLQASGGNVSGGTAAAGLLGANASGIVDLAIAAGGVSATGAQVHLYAANGYSVAAVGDSMHTILRADGTSVAPVFESTDGLNAGSTIELDTDSGEVVQQVGRNLTAANLLLRGNAQYTLTNEGNDVNVFAAGSGGGVIRYVDMDALQVGSVAGVAGIARDGDVSLLALTGDLTLAQNADVASHTLRLQAADGNLSGGTAIAGTLGARASGNVDLGIAAGAVSAAGANVRLTSGDGYTIAQVGDADRAVQRADGSSGAAVFQAVTGLGAGATIELNTAGGEVTQQAAQNVLAPNLLLRGAAQYTLANEGNSVATLAADTGAGPIRYVDADGLVVGSVVSLAGATVTGIVRTGDVSLRTQTGDLTLAQDADVGAATLRLQAAAGDVLGGTARAGTLGARASGTVDLGIAAAVVSAEGTDVRLTSAGGYSIGAVGDADRAVQDTGNSGVAVFQATDGLQAGSTLELVTGGGEVVQQAGRDIAASGLLLRGAAGYTLTNAGNNVVTLAADTGGGVIRYVDADSLAVGRVVPLAGEPAVPGISRAGDVSLRTQTGDLTLAADADVGAATLRLQALAGNVGGGTARAGTLGARASGDVDLGVAAGTVSAEGANVRLVSGSGYSIGAVVGDDRLVSGADGSAIFQAVDGLRAGSTIELDTGGGTVTQPAHDLAAANLLLRGAGSYTLTRTSNTVGTLAADSGGGAIRYVDADGLEVGAVKAVADGASVVGLSRDGDVTLRTMSGDLTLAQGADVAGVLRLQAQRDVQQSGGSISATDLGVVAGGNVALKNLNTVAGTVALQAGGDLWFGAQNGYTIGSVPAMGAGSGTGAEFQGAAGLRAAGTIELQTLSGEVGQVDPVSAANLLLRGSAAYQLDGTANTVGAFAAASGGSADGSIRFSNSGDLVLKPLTGPSGSGSAGIVRTGSTAVDATGTVTFSGDFVASGGSHVDVTSHAEPSADADRLATERATYVNGRTSPYDQGLLFAPSNPVDSSGAGVRIASAVILQDDGSTVTVDGDTALRLTSSRSGSITLDGAGNDFAGGSVSARSVRDGVQVSLPKDDRGDVQLPPLLSRVAINGKVVNVGASGASVSVANYGGAGTAAKTVEIGVEADLVRFEAEKITTGDNFIVARYSATSIQPYEYQLPGLAIKMLGASSYVQDNFGAIGDRGVAATGEGPGLKVMVGYDPDRAADKERTGWVMVLPATFKLDAGVADGLADFRASQARISFTGPVVAKPVYIFASPGVQSTVPIFYNGETPLDPAQRSALSAIDSLQERLRREQVEQSVSTENVARDLRQGVIVEVGTGPAATTGSGARAPQSCPPAGGSLSCQAAP